MNLQTKIILLLIPILAIPLAIVGLIAYQQLYQNTLQNRLHEMELALDQVKRSFAQELTAIEANITLFSSNYLVQKYAVTTDENERFGLLQRPLLNLFDSYQKTFPDYYEIRFIFPDGYEGARLTPKPMANASEEELDDPFIQSLFNEDRNVKSSIHINPDNEELALYTGLPLYLSDPSVEPLSAPQVLRGAVTITNNLNILRSLVLNTKFGNSGHLLVLSKNGDTYFNQVEVNNIAPSIKMSPNSLQNLLSADKEAELINLSGSNYYVRSSQFFPGMYLVAVLGESELEPITQNLALTVILITIVSILIFSFLVFFLIRRLVLIPLEQLDRVSTQISKGELNVQVESHGDDEISRLATTFNEMIINLQIANQDIKQFNRELENRVHERTAELKSVNHELESFAYSVSHDLRTPLRAIDGFSHALADDYGDILDENGKEYLRRVRKGAQRMGILIDDLLQLSRINRVDIEKKAVDLAVVAEEVIEELKAGDPDKKVDIKIGGDLKAFGDSQLLRVLMDNLLSNAWKFTGREPLASIIFDHDDKNPDIFYVKDNGVGFTMKNEKKLFGAFERLHNISEFPGSGVGLATVKRIINRHGGEIWAEAKEGEGATFFFTLNPKDKK